ncbi:MAG: TPM domain-containing protein [bacterium]
MNFKAVLWNIVFFISCILCLASSAYGQYPAYNGYVNDYAGIISAAADQRLEQLLTALDKKTSAQVAVAVMKDIGDEDIETYAADLFKEWGIGQKGTDNGVLLLIITEQRKFRIEVGYGLEGVLPDAKAGYILDNIVRPHFRKGDFDEGITAGVEAIAAEILTEYNLTLSDLVEGYQYQTIKTRGISVPPFINTIIGIIVLLVLLVLFLTNPSLLFALLLSGFLTRGGSSGGVWTGGGGGFGGGFGGFGGGMSGGGGATSGW